MFLGKYLAPHVKKGGTTLLSSTARLSKDEASRKVDEIFNVTAGAIEGFATIYQSLEHSALVLGHSLTNNTVEVVKHKYGSSASKFTEDTFLTVGNSLQIANNIRIFKPNNLVTSTATGTFTDECKRDFTKSNQNANINLNDKSGKSSSMSSPDYCSDTDKTDIAVSTHQYDERVFDEKENEKTRQM